MRHSSPRMDRVSGRFRNRLSADQYVTAKTFDSSTVGLPEQRRAKSRKSEMSNENNAQYSCIAFAYIAHIKDAGNLP